METQLPDSVARLIADHLPDYRQGRECYPLWTYSRDDADWGAIEIPGLVERLRWAHAIHFGALGAEIQDSAGPEWILFAYTPGTVEAMFLSDGGATPSRSSTFLQARARLPLFLLSRSVAILSALAWPRIPDQTNEIPLLRSWSKLLPLDACDIDFLGWGMHRMLRFDGPEVPDPRVAQPNYFHHVVDLQRRSLISAGRSKKERRELQRQRQEVAEPFGLRDLIPCSRTTDRTFLAASTLSRLEREARHIVKEVHSYHPSSERKGLFVQLRERDRQRRELDQDKLDKLTQAQYVRWKRMVSNLEPHHFAALRFPFLLPNEIKRIMESPHRQYVRTAQELVCARLPGKPSTATLRRRIRDAR